MRRLSRLCWIAVLAALAHSPAAAAKCRIQLFPPIPITMEGLRPMIATQINGHRARFFIDSGSFWSMLAPATRAEFNLPDEPAPAGFWLRGIGGDTAVDIATVDTFTFLGVQLHRVQFLVGDNGFPSGAAGLIGGNILRVADVEYDFADGVMRFVRPEHCGDEPLAYWAAGHAVGMVELRRTSALQPQLIGHASVNGHDIRVLFDTGSPRSMLTLEAAKRAGITPASPGVEPAGMISGTGRGVRKSWIAPVALFEIGGEKIEHTHVLIGDVHSLGVRADMLLGADFFLSHRIYVANSRHELYFTYNGGPVFDLGQRYWIQRAGSAPALPGAGLTPSPGKQGPGTTPVAAGGPSSTHAASGEAGGKSRASATADALMREGMAYASEGQYAPALADLSRACRLDPNDPVFLLRRGNVYWADRQPAKALADYDAAVKRRPNFYRGRLARAWLLVEWKRAPAGAASQARADADIVEMLAPDESELRLSLAQLYGRMGNYAAAIRELDHWIYYHEKDVRMPAAWNARCRFRAAADVDLKKALKDCDRALGRLPKSAEALDSRGLVYLRLGRLDQSIADYDAALKIRSTLATSLYGRGLAELREGKQSSGQADLAAAARLDRGIAKRFARMGLRP